ncbi:MAG: tetratricopeptide repeat-containing sensor histidine kinase [Candidatus Promineifilaceae bacterium]
MTRHISAQETLESRIQFAYPRVEKGFGDRQELESLRDQAQAIGYKIGVADANTLLALYFYLDATYEPALKTGLLAATQYEQPIGRGMRTLLYGVLGTIYSRTGAYHEALRYFYRQREVSEGYGDSFALANANIGLAIVYSDIGEHERALRYDETALHLFTQLEDRERMATVHMQMCHSHSEAGHYADALEAGHGGLALCTSDAFYGIKGWIQYNMAIPLAQLGEPKTGLRSALDALKIARERDDLLLTTMAHVAIGRCYALLGDLQLAQQHFELGLGLSIQLGTKRIAYEVNNELAQLYKTRGDIRSAFSHYERYMDLHHQLFGEQVVTKLRNQEILRQTEASQREADVAREVNLKLERRVAERTEELEKALQLQQHLARDLKQAFEQQEQFNQLQSKIIATVSHAFRTPMTVIGASADLLEKFYDRMGPNKREMQFSRIRVAIQDLTQMLQDAMQVNSVSTPNVALNLEWSSFRNACSMLETNLKREIPVDANVNFHYSGVLDEKVHLDMPMVQRILFNLVSNSLKYGHPEVEVDVTIQLRQHHLKMVVVDNGAGIPRDEIDGLFQLFARGSNVEAKRGLGLGLYTVRRIVEAMNGTVSAESPGVNCGSTFTIKLPIV